MTTPRAARRPSGFARWGAAVGGLVVLEGVRRARAQRLVDPHAAPPAVRASDGSALHVELDGRKDAALTVVLVHGYGARLEEWRPQREVLARHARLVLFDQRGHGRSGWRHHRHATIDQLGRDLLAVLDAHAAGQPVVLVGHSMGGMAVLALAASRPDLFGDRVVGVGLLSTSAGHLMETGLSHPVAAALRRTHALAPLLWLLWFVAPVLDALSPFGTERGRRLLDRRLFGAGPAPRDALDGAQWSFQTTRQSALAAFAPSLLHHNRAGAVSALRGLPVLVLTGSADATIPPSHSRRISEELAGQCELLVVPGAGHLVNVTHADAVSAALLRLLRRSTRAPHREPQDPPTPPQTPG